MTVIARLAALHSGIAAAVNMIIALCAVIPYALIALIIRLIMARAFFLSGQDMIAGPRVPFDLRNFEFSITLPAQVKAETFEMFQTKFAAVPLPPHFSAYFVSYAEFFLPILLVLGFATRLSAAILLIMTVVIQVYVLPQAFWTVHVYRGALLLVLMTVGPGAVSIDRMIRFLGSR
jgi:putative oxidoreductase